ncbi:MAG: L-2-hydroxyglutarate oxidase [Thermoleophilia bacterium]|nr:L-2-hydroxyglutarate oxidase [Thermoleophilia bacterium]
MPSSGRWVANFSGRWTPPPPAGGKYIVTSRTFTPGDDRDGDNAAVAQPYDAIVVGGGILGLATARQLLADRPGLRLMLLEKESALARHQSAHNSGVIHSGVYYTPGSLRAKLCVEGKTALERYADQRGIERVERGKLIVALDETELGRLAELERRGRANGVVGLRVLDAEALRRIEPNVRGIRALHAPHTGVIDYGRVSEALAEDVRTAGGEIQLRREVTRIAQGGRSVEVATRDAIFEGRMVVSCAGLQSDRISGSETRIVPFRGDYYTLSPRAAELVNGLVYPVPDPAFPFLGVHLTRRVDGTVVAGPNAVLAFARERYRRAAISLRDTAATFGHPGFWRFAARHLRAGVDELWRDVSKRAFVRDVQRLVPAITTADVRFGPSGIRAQALGLDGRLLDDFVFAGGGRILHVVNAPSPAATSSLAIGAHIARLALEMLA